ncbi:hypothetical protein ACB098_08G011600 [Castanea mollissima]
MSSSNRAKNFRRRAGNDNDDNQNDDANLPSSFTTTTGRSAKPKPKKLLSFADDEDASVATSKKTTSNSSSRPTTKHKITSLRDRQSATATTTSSNVQPQAGTYTKEALLELQKNTRTLAPSRPASEPIVVLKGLVKPSSEQELDDEEEDRRNAEDTEAKLASLGIGKPTRDSSSFPDQATINAIRAKRERLRQSRAAAPDYISLDGGSNHGEAEGLSDEEPEFRGRIAMFGEKKTDMVTMKKGVFEDVDESGIDVNFGKKDIAEDEGVDEDEEEKIWEEEQFRKGLGKRMDDGTGRVAVVTATSVVPVVHSAQQQQQQQQKFVYPAVTSVSGVPSIAGAVGASQGLDAMMSIPKQAEIAKKALLENVKRLKESHGRTMSSLTKTDEDLSASYANITAFGKSLSIANDKFIFMQKLRQFVSVICDFLQYKAPYIEELEEQMQKIHEERASANLERRAAENDDEMEVEAAVNAATSVFSKKGSSAEMVAAATSAAQAASAAVREQTNQSVKLDEFGRDMNRKKHMDMTKRADRRKARFDSKRISSMELDSSNQRIEGELSSDESDSELQLFEHRQKSLIQIADKIFSDAAEEYSQLSVVKEKFEKWKRDYSASYHDAYMALSVPEIFSPYVRLELLKWDPLHEDVDFFDMKWHSLLFNYGVPNDGSDFGSDDADANLVPELVEKVPTWSPLVLKAVPNAARVAAYRFGRSVRLMRNICLWKEILALPVLEKLVLDELLFGKVLPHVRSITTNVHDAITRTERIIASLSNVWAGPNISGERSHKLQALVDYLLLLGKTLEKRHVIGITESETSGLARRLKKMLVELNEYDNARDIARTFHLKEAL